MSEPGKDGRNYSPRPSAPITRLVPRDCAGLRIDQALARMFPEHSRTRLTGWLRDGRIRVNEAAAKPNQKIWGGETVELDEAEDPSTTPAGAEDIALPVVHEDDAVIVIDKPAGLVVHPGSGNWTGTLMNALLHHAPELAAVPRAGIVHRLDKDTSGLLVVARTLEAQTALVRQLQERSVERIYLALAHGVIERDGSVEAPVGRDRRVRTRMAVTTAGKPALTRYRVMKRYAQATLLECSLSTGRTHQIRVHLHSVGHPLVGDPVYRLGKFGARESDGFRRQALHAARLAFVHPASAERVRFEAPLPADMRALLSGLK